MRFATRVLLLQLATVVAVVAMCTAVFAFLAVQQLRAESEASALNIARTVAEDPDVRRLVADYSSDPGTPDAAALRSALGDALLPETALQRIRAMLVDVGAVAAVEQHIDTLTASAADTLDAAGLTEPAATRLRALAVAATSRDH